MVDAVDYGRRPYFAQREPRDPRSAEAMKVCPGIELSHTFDRNDPALIRELLDGWGPIREVWEGYAADPEIRFVGSSGGVATALALYCLEHAGFYGVLHTRARRDAPYLNETVLSRTREELLAGAGSRYAPASPCDGLKRIEDAPGPCVFIGKPCDVAAVQKARRLRPSLDAKIGLTIAFFCAGTPSTRGTLEMLKRMGVDDPTKVTSLRYRGHGWPGEAVAQYGCDGSLRQSRLSYEESWGLLTRFRQWRCAVCADHSGEFADIAVGDPWYRPIADGDPGRSLVLVRTPRGREIVHPATGASYLVLEKQEASLLPRSQCNLLRARGAVWGRLLLLWMSRIPKPRYKRLPMFRTWLIKLGVKDKLRSTIGTLLRMRRRRLGARHPVTRCAPAASDWHGMNRPLSQPPEVVSSEKTQLDG